MKLVLHFTNSLICNSCLGEQNLKTFYYNLHLKGWGPKKSMPETKRDKLYNLRNFQPLKRPGRFKIRFWKEL